MSRKRRFLVVAVLPLLISAAISGDPEVAADSSPAPDLGTTSGAPTIHSSDGVAGRLLSSFPVPAKLNAKLRAARAAGTRTDEVAWQVAPGLDYSQWTDVERQGHVRIFLLTAHMDQPGLVLDQVSGPTVSARAPLSTWIDRDNAVAGVNADFFDIDDTGAPLGVGVDREQHVLHAPSAGWNTTFLLGHSYKPDVVQDRLIAHVTPHGGSAIKVSTYNSPSVPVGGIGLYTPTWGTAPGRPVLDKATRVRQVVIRDGMVTYNSNKLSQGKKFRGTVLLGSDHGARVLRTKLKVGELVSVKRSLSVAAHVAVSGSTQLLHNGVATTKDNGELHPRTAIGIDRDQDLIHLVVVDGRSESSSGFTLLQLSNLLKSFGDEEGLNLDGGGSSTMVAAGPNDGVLVRNAPSDGHERPVPNGLGFRYTAPTG